MRSEHEGMERKQFKRANVLQVAGDMDLILIFSPSTHFLPLSSHIFFFFPPPQEKREKVLQQMLLLLICFK